MFLASGKANELSPGLNLEIQKEAHNYKNPKTNATSKSLTSDWATGTTIEESSLPLQPLAAQQEAEFHQESQSYLKISWKSVPRPQW